MDEEIINRIESEKDLESLRQSLYDLLALSDKSKALSIAIEYTHHESWMIRRNAIIILGRLQDSKAAPGLLEIIENEVTRKHKWVEINDKGEIAKDIDIHILKACVDSLIQCGNPEHIFALSKYTDSLTYEPMFGEETITKIKEAVYHVPRVQSQTVTSVDKNNLPKSQEEHRSWEVWLRKEKEKLEREQQELRAWEERLLERERELASDNENITNPIQDRVVVSIEVAINNTRYSTVKNKVTPYEYIRQSLIDCGLKDTVITYDPNFSFYY
jgi:hypothetical protein